MKMLFPHKFLTLILLTSFIGLAVFGFATMAHGENHNPNGCIAAASREVDCAIASGPLAMFNLHIDALKIFSTLSFGSFSFQSLLLLIFSLILFLGLKMSLAPPMKYAFLPYVRAGIWDFLPKLRTNFSNWFSLHENSPTFG